MPDLDNLAPSLVEWVADDVEEDVVRILQAVRQTEDTELTLVCDPLLLVLYGTGRERVWQRSWKLCLHTGAAHEVQLHVAEARDAEVIVRINHVSGAQLTPPWMDEQVNGQQLSPAGAREERRRFHNAVVAAVAEGLAYTWPLIT
jgi:hypothetical protein